MKIALWLALSLTACALTGPSRLTLKPGKYEIASVWVFDGKPRNSISAHRCIAAADLAYPERVFNAAIAANSVAQRSCAIANLNYSDGRVSYDLDCTQVVTHVLGTYSEAGYSVVRTLEPKSKSGTPSQIKLDARRIADCEEAQK